MKAKLPSSKQQPRLHRQFGWRWAEELKCSTGVYLRRWVLETPVFSLRLHHWLHSDDSRAFHDHPWGFWTFVFRGVYLDVSPDLSQNPECDPQGHVIVQRMAAPKLAHRPANHKHYVFVPPKGAWTILFTGPKVRRWGFWLREKFILSYRYFYQFGGHTCD